MLNGRWGPYISFKKKNYRIPKTIEAGELSLKECLELVEKGGKTSSAKKGSTKKKSSTKKSTAKKSTKKK